MLISTYVVGENLTTANLSLPIPSDMLFQYSSRTATIFTAVFFFGIFFCFIVSTLSLVLYFCFCKEPGIKATSVSLSMLIFIGCYLLIVYMLILNFTLLPSYPRLSSKLRNVVCFTRVWLNALGFPIALILSTLLVKLLRVYRIFNCYSKMNRNSCKSLTLAGLALLITSPNAVVCLIWSTADPYRSTVSLSVEAGQLVLAEQCVSTYAIQWLVGLLIYNTVLSIILVILAIFDSKILKTPRKSISFALWLCSLELLLCFTGI